MDRKTPISFNLQKYVENISCDYDKVKGLKRPQLD